MSGVESGPSHAGRDRALRILLLVYKSALSPILHLGASGACRFQPSCSEYAILAIHQHGIVAGGWLALKRILRCHPGHRAGFDPVPATLRRPG